MPEEDNGTSGEAATPKRRLSAGGGRASGRSAGSEDEDPVGSGPRSPAPPRPAHQALPALSIQARYPFSSRSICCWRRSFMKALRFSTRSLSLANSLWTGRRRGTRFRQRHDEEKGGAGPPGVSVRAPHPLAPSRSPRRHLCSLKCCTGTRSTRPPAGSLPRSVSLPWALTPSACSLLKGTFLVATECATTWVSKCYV